MTWILIAVIILAGMIYYIEHKGKKDKYLDKEPTLRRQEIAEHFQKKGDQEGHTQKQEQSFMNESQKPQENKSNFIRDAASVAAGAAILHRIRKEQEEAKKLGLENDKELNELWEDDLEDMEDQLDEYEDEQLYASLNDSYDDEPYNDDEYYDTTFTHVGEDEIEYRDE